jgi:hypothetical protein
MLTGEWKMKKFLLGWLVLGILLAGTPAFAGLGDTKETIGQQYGDFRLVIDSDNQPWTKEQWEKSGYKKAQADTYTYRFRRNDIGIGMDVKYEGDKPGSFVRMQRVTPDMPFQIKDFQKMFPELYPLVSSSESVVFATYKELSRNLMEKNSPVTMGVAVKTDLGGSRKGYFTLMAFNVQDEGRLIKDAKYIDANTYIREFTIERTYLSVLKDNLHNEWNEMTNYFLPNPKPVTPPAKKSGKSKTSGK